MSAPNVVDTPRLKRLSLLTSTPSRASSGKSVRAQPLSPRKSGLTTMQDMFNSQSMAPSALGEAATNGRNVTEYNKTSSSSSGADGEIASPTTSRTRRPRPLSVGVSNPATSLSPHHRSSLSIQSTPRSRQRHPDSMPYMQRGREQLLFPTSRIGGNGTREGLLRPMTLRMGSSGEWRNPIINSEENIGEIDVLQPPETKKVAGGDNGAITLMEQYASLLSEIAQKEASVQETRQELRRQEEELALLKSQWQAIISQSHPSPTVRLVSAPTTSTRKQPPRPSFRSSPSFAESTPEQSITEIDGRPSSTSKAGAAMEEGKKLFGHFLDNLVGIQEETTSSADHPGKEDSMSGGRIFNNIEHPVISLESPITLQTRPGPPPSTTAEKAIQSLFSNLATSPGTESSWAETAASWGDVVGLGSPTIQEGSKRATAFLSANLTETFNALSKVLPTPNLTMLTASQAADGRKCTTVPRRVASASPYNQEKGPSGKEACGDTQRTSRPKRSSRFHSFLDDDLEDTSGLSNVLTPSRTGMRISSSSSDRSDDKDLAEWNW